MAKQGNSSQFHNKKMGESTMPLLHGINVNKYFYFFIIFMLGIITLMPQQSEAVPAFARQMGMSCSSCHFQNFPALNNFGRVFRAQGFTMRGSQKLIEGDKFSFPVTLNASVITKLRYQAKGSDAEGRGEIQWPDEAALLIGGRASEYVGFLMELGLGPQEADLGTGEVTGNFLSTKFHFNITDDFAVIPFSTDGLGVGYGFELLNTGAQRSQRPIENRKGFSAAQMLGLASGEATGAAFVYHASDWFINYSHWLPNWGNAQADAVGGLADYIRLVYMPNIGGWDTGFGVSSMSGSVKTGGAAPTITNVDGWVIDAQAQGQVGTMPLGIYASYGVAPKSTASETNKYNTSTTDDSTSLGLVAKLGVIPSKLQIYLGYGSLDKNATNTKTSTVGLQYNMAQNIKIELYNVSSDSSNNADDYTMLMLFAGF